MSASSGGALKTSQCRAHRSVLNWGVSVLLFMARPLDTLFWWLMFSYLELDVALCFSDRVSTSGVPCENTPVPPRRRTICTKLTIGSVYLKNIWTVDIWQ